MAFRNKLEILMGFNPDIAIIQECENEEVLKTKKAKIKFNKIIWVGNNKNKGIGVIAFNDFNIELLEHNNEFKYVLPIKIFNNHSEYVLLAIWTQLVNKNIYESYVVQATRAFNFYNSLLQKENILIIGDFNSNAIWDNDSPKEYNHSQMVGILNKRKIVSVYHTMNNEEHGKESIPTLYFRKNQNHKYHIDYFFLHENSVNYIESFSIGEYDQYIKQSDHMPLFIKMKN